MAEWVNDIPKWEGNVVEPPESKKVQGYIAGDRPPAAWENWYRNAIGKAVTENRAAIATKQAQLIAGNNIEIVGNTIRVVGDLGLTEEEVKLVKVNSAKDADTVGGHMVEKDVPQDAKFTDTIVDISGKVDKVVGKGLSTNDYSNIEKQKVEDNKTSINNHVDRDFSTSPLHGWRLDDNNKAEYWNGTEWVRVKGDGFRVGNVSNLQADEDDRVVTITLSDPPDTIVKDSAGNDITISKWKGTMVRRKTGSYPIDENDGELVFDNQIRDKYKTQGYRDEGLINDTEYFYMAFPYTEEDLFTIDSANRISATPTEVDPNSWAGIQKIVRKGLANEFFTVGDQIASNYDGGEVIWEVIGIDVDTPADSQFQHSMTIQTRDCLYNKVFDPGNDNRYVNSPIRAHLNSEFLNKLDPELSVVLGAVDKRVAKRNDLGGGQDSFSDKVFLLSRVEVGLGTEGVTTGEKVYPFYNGVANAARIKNLNGSPWLWWLRSPHVGNSYSVRNVSTSGSFSSSNASNTIGVSPACVII